MTSSNWRHVFIVAIVLFAPLTSSYVVAAPTSTADQDSKAFEASEAFAGQEIKLKGYLLYRFENKNLYPTSSWHDEWKRKRCIPIGIDVVRKELAARAQKLDGTYVVVRGKVLQLVGENQLNASFCKDVGILLDSIETAK